MNHAGGETRRGSILLICLLVVLILFSLVATMLSLSLLENTVARENTDDLRALNLAEYGLELAKWEIGEGQDPDGDGIGDVSGTTPDGTYAARILAGEDGIYQLESIGQSGVRTRTVIADLELVMTTAFPESPLTTIGGVEKADLALEPAASLVLDGLDGSVMHVSDKLLYDALRRMGGLIDDDDDDDSGMIFTPRLDPSYPAELDRLHEFHKQLSEQIEKTFLPTAIEQKFPSKASGATVWGSEKNPVTYSLTDAVLPPGSTLKGFGTLIVTKRLLVDSGALIDWTGDLIVRGGAANDALFELNGGGVSVTGNVIVYADADHAATIKLSSSSKLGVVGNLLLMTDLTETKQAIAKLVVQSLAAASVTGLFTHLGRQPELKMHLDSRLYVQGMVQSALPPIVGTGVKWDLDGDVDITLDRTRIRDGVVGLQELAKRYDVPLTELLFRYDFVVRSWRGCSE